MGPRWPGSEGHTRVRQYIRETMTSLGWEVTAQSFEYQGFQAQNLIAKANIGKGPIIIVGAHYDTRRIADQSNTSVPVPGAVDGASGVAVLLELGRSLDLNLVGNELWLVFFDIEDQGRGGMPGFDYAAGAAYMAENLTVEPEAMILVDMVGDADQQLYYEGNSDRALQQELWALAANLGYGGVFIPQLRHTVIDDHVPFARRGIPAVDIIDFDYPYWHTTEDTIDKASPTSLLRVGRTLEVWLEG